MARLSHGGVKVWLRGLVAGARSRCHHPNPGPDHRRHLQPRDGGEIGAKRFFARLMPKRRPPGISTGSAAKERQLEQRGFADPPPAVRGEGGEVYRD